MSFTDLYDGKIESIKISINNEDFPCGVYEMTHEECLNIIKSIDSSNNPRQTALIIDEIGMGNRWFRLHPSVLKWIKNKTPLMTYDFAI